MVNFKDKKCSECGVVFSPKGPAAKYCSTCAKIKALEAARRGTLKYDVKNGRTKNPGIGSGGGQANGEANHMYKNGSRHYQNSRARIRERRYCERCGKDLKDVGPKYWCVHHRDHNRNHNEDSNYELLCKRCHQIEHNCIKALQK